MLDVFSNDILNLWGNRAENREFVWPINMRLGAIT